MPITELTNMYGRKHIDIQEVENGFLIISKGSFPSHCKVAKDTAEAIAIVAEIINEAPPMQSSNSTLGGASLAKY